jgi:hypothetical protein
MKILRKDLVYLFLQAKRNLPKPIIMMMINPVDKRGGDREEPTHKKYKANKSATHMPQMNITATTSLIH